MPKQKITLRDIGRVVGGGQTSPFTTLKRPVGDIGAHVKDVVRRGRLVDKYGKGSVEDAEREALSLSYNEKLGKVGTPEYRQKEEALSGIRKKVKEQERVESYKLTLEQKNFMKQYKQTTGVYKMLQTNLNASLSEADKLRNALIEVETEMGALVNRAKGFRFDRLEGQDNIQDEPNEQTMPNRQRLEMGGMGMGMNNE